MRHAVAYQKRQPEGSVRDAWARHHSHYPGYLLARAPQHAERGCQSYGGRPELERSGVKVVSNVPWAIAQGTLAASLVLPFLQDFLEVPEVGLEPTRCSRTTGF